MLGLTLKRWWYNVAQSNSNHAKNCGDGGAALRKITLNTYYYYWTVSLCTAQDVAYCHQYQCSVYVCLCVCHNHEPYKSGRTDRGAVSVWTRVVPKNHVLGGCPDSPPLKKGATLCGSYFGMFRFAAVNILNCSRWAQQRCGLWAPVL